MNFFTNLFAKDVKDKVERAKITSEEYVGDDSVFSVKHIYSNDYPRIISQACSVCWDKKPPTTTDAQVNYIARRIKTGHTSILEHSNIVFFVQANVTPFTLKEVARFTAEAKYLNIKVHYYDETLCMLIGGSLRGYFDIINRLYQKAYKNEIVQGIMNEFYSYSYKEFFQRYIDAGMMEDRFLDNDQVDINRQRQIHSPHTMNTNVYDDNITIAGIDSLHYLYKYLLEETGFTIEPTELLEFCTVSILFKDMSRTATHQLVRHRNAITQESQRYVDYSDAKFIDPSKYDDKLKNQKYTINFDGSTHTMFLDDLGDVLCSIYGQLIEPNGNGSDAPTPLRREEARAFLPSNVACGKLYMTFNLLNFFKFIELRTDKAAQGEIRDFATSTLDFYMTYVENMHDHKCDEIPYDTKYLMPKFIRYDEDTYDNVDEPVE